MNRPPSPPPPAPTTQLAPSQSSPRPTTLTPIEHAEPLTRAEFADDSASGIASRIGMRRHRSEVLARTDSIGSSSRDDQDFDALTDLFLGEARRSSVGQKQSHRSDAARATEAAQPAAPVLRLIRDDDDAPPAGPGVASPSAADIAQEQPDDLEPEGEAIWSGVPVPPPARTPVVECVVLGNLPMLAAAWANQHAREVAVAAEKPVAVLRLQGGYASVEIVSSDAAVGHDAATPGSIDDAIESACELTDRWMIRLEPGGENAALRHDLLRVVTILTGTDQMAREACRHTLDRLARALTRAADDAEPPATAPMVRIGVMGAITESGTTEAIARIARETLGESVPTFTSAGKIHSAKAARVLFSGPTERGIAELMDLLAWLLMPDAKAKPAPGPASLVASTDATPTPAPPAVTSHADMSVYGPSAEPAVVPAPQVESLEGVDEPAASWIEAPAADAELELPLPSPTPSVVEAIVGDAVPDRVLTQIPAPIHVDLPAPQNPVVIPAAPAETAAWTSSTAAQPAPESSAQITPARATGAADDFGALANHVAGLTPIAARCPYAPSIEIAVDADGVVHMLTRVHDGKSDESALAELMVASSWFTLHAGLLAAGLGRSLRADGVELHLFTDQPKRSRRLLDTMVRVHLFTRVDLGDQRAWCCVELN